MRRIAPAAAALALVFAVPGERVGHASELPSDQPILYHATGLKIYRGLTRQGLPALVLTNVDEEGNVLPGGEEGRAGEVTPRPGPAAEPSPGANDHPSPAGRTPKDVTVLVQREGDALPVAERNVEVRDEGAGGTTVIVNVNIAPAQETPASTYTYPVVVQGGIAGPFHYPDRLNFLGYGLKNDTPVYFGGFGLSSTERYSKVLGKNHAPAGDCAETSNPRGRSR